MTVVTMTERRKARLVKAVVETSKMSTEYKFAST